MKYSDILIRPMLPKDVPQVHDIETASFSDPWSINSFNEGLLYEHNLYMSLLSLDEEVWGYACVSFAADEASVDNIAVRSDMRHKGCGKLLLESMTDILSKKGVNRLYLEVRASNDNARFFYIKNGFSQLGIRKGFYSKPLEDAVVMMKVIGNA